jgi:prepilin-type processing-associated H-X9-DG protein
LFSVLDAATYQPGTPSLFIEYLTNRLIVLTWLLVFPVLLFALLSPALPAAREATRRSQCYCGCLGLAFFNYHETHGSLPPAYTVDENGKPLHSWRVLILPFLEQNELYKKIRLDEPWDSEHNRQFHDVKIHCYGCPSASGIVPTLLKNRGTFRAGNCHYSVVVGDETLFPGSKTTSFDEITGGTSNTILYVERLVPICWMDPNSEIRFETACEGINRTLLGIGGGHPGGAIVGFADGHVRFLKESADGRIETNNKTYESIKPLLTKSDD